MIDARGKELVVEHLSLPSVTVSAAPDATRDDTKMLSDNLKDNEKEHVKKVLEQANGNIAEASRVLGISRARIYRILR